MRAGFLLFCSFFILSFAQAQCGLDVFVANDQSGSVDDLENTQGRHFIAELMRNMNPWGTANNQSRMAVAEWDNGGTWTQFNFPSAGQNYTTQLSDVITYQNSPRVLSGGTDPYSALLKTYNAISQTPVVGRTANQIIVLMTDASCDQIQGDIVNLATQIKDNGIYIIVMAIDNAQGCSVLQGENVASAGGYFSASSYAELEQKAITYIRNIISASCVTPPTPTFDLSIQLNNFTATNCVNGTGTYKADYTINNIGRAAWNNTITISFYDGDPTLPTSKYIAVQNIGTQTIAVNGSISGSLSSPLLAVATNLYAIVNFDGSLASNAPPLPYDLKNRLVIAGERNEKNNFSSGIIRANDNSCSPKAILNVDVHAGNVGCDNTVNYEVEICNRGDAVAKVDDINPIIPSGFVLNNTTNTPDTFLTRMWGTYYGDPIYNYASNIVTDNQNNIYMAFYSATTVNSLLKFNDQGNLLWSSYYGGDSTIYVEDLALDSQGNIYMTGFTNTRTNIATAGAYQTVYGGNWDAFLVKFNNQGVRQWSTYFGGSQKDEGFGVAVDIQDNIYIVGSTKSHDNISTNGAFQTSLGGTDMDGFLAKFNNQGVRQWATYYGTDSMDYIKSIATDLRGNLYITGPTKGINYISTSGAHQVNNGGDVDAFIAKFNNLGIREWGTFYGGSFTEAANSLKVDSHGNIYMTGNTLSSNNISTLGSFQPNILSLQTAFLVKFNNQGVRQWATYLGNGTNSSRIALDSQGYIYIRQCADKYRTCYG